MLKLSGVGLRFGGRTVLDRVSFVLGAGERAGLVGPSGSGKTTLLRIIAGVDRPETGSVERPPGGRIGYLRQGYDFIGAPSAAEVFPAAFDAALGDRDLEDLARRVAAERDPTRAADLADAYAAALARLEDGVGAGDIRAHWAELGLRDIAPDEPVTRLSGGEQTKLGLLDLMASAPDALLLDEPTNNLDVAGLEWLGRRLDAFLGPVLIVSHDRAFLDEHVDVILELDPATGRVEAFPGSYADYRDEKARRQDALWSRYLRQQQRERRIQEAIAGLKARAQRTENRTINFYFRKRALKVARRAVTLQRRLGRELESGDHIDKPVRTPYGVRVDLPEAQRAGARALVAAGLCVTAGDRTLLAGADLTLGGDERAVLIGPNGSGKTLLLRTLLGERAPAAGLVQLGPSVRAGYLAQSAEDAEADTAALLRHGRTPLEVVRRATPLSEGDARRFLHRFLFTSEHVHTPIARLSYGERRRLDLARLVVSGANLLVLDEPTNHLDIQSREAFEAALDGFAGALLVVTHDRYFIDRFADTVLTIEDGRLRRL